MIDTVITGATVVRPDQGTADELDIGITGGRVSHLSAGLAATAGAAEVFDATGLIAFPGSVDAHTHMGIYNPLDVDAATESRAAAQGGTTTVLNYVRTGQYYLNRGGPYAEFVPEALGLMEGRSYVDYALHLAPMQASHIDEMPALVDEHGVTSFKIFMFYGSHGLHGASDDQSSFLMIPPGERYDFAHFEFVMRGLAGVRRDRPELADVLSLSMHCETAEIMTAYTKMVQAEGRLSGLAAYSAGRPPHSEGLAVTIAAYLAHETEVVNINLLHLSSAKAMDAALRMDRCFENVDFRREVTVGHLLADIETAGDPWGKVNPPIRPRADVEALWEHVLAGDAHWVVSDHACCRAEAKVSAENPDDVWLAKSGFGGTEYLLNGLYSEGSKRGLGLVEMARMLSWNPARRFGLGTKGTIGVGYDADIALLDPAASHVVRAGESESSQGYTPLRGPRASRQGAPRVAARRAHPGQRPGGGTAPRPLPEEAHMNAPGALVGGSAWLRESAGLSHQAGHAVAELILQPGAGLDQDVEVEPGIETHLVHHVHHVLGGDVTGGPGRERAAAHPTEAGVEHPHANFDGRRDVGQRGVAGVVEVAPQHDVGGLLGGALEQGGHLGGHPDADGVGQGHLVGLGLGQLGHDSQHPVGVDPPLVRAAAHCRHGHRGADPGRPGRVGDGPPPLDRLGHRGPLVRLREGLGGHHHPAHLVGARFDGPLHSPLVEHERAVADTLGAGHAGHDRLAVGHLGHRLGADEAGRLDPGVAGRDQALDQPHLLRSAEVGGVGLEAVAGGDIHNLDALGSAVVADAGACGVLVGPGRDGAEDNGEGDHARSTE